jgi:hypothetical protein
VSLSYVFGAFVLLLVLLRQVRVVPVPRVFRPRLPVFLGVLGLLAIGSYTDGHHVSGAAWAWVLTSVLVGAPVLGALRGLAMRVWAGNGWVLRQATALTMVLWLASLLLHVVLDATGHGDTTAGLSESSFLLYLGLTLWAQYAVVQRRAEPLFANLGPGANRPLQVNFMAGPGVFFTTFRDGPRGASAQQHARSGPGEVIDAEVVEDDNPDPPELPRPG